MLAPVRGSNKTEKSERTSSHGPRPARGQGRAAPQEPGHAARPGHLGRAPRAEWLHHLGRGQPRGQRGDPGNGRHGAFGASEGRDVPHRLRSRPCVDYRKWDIRNRMDSTAKAWRIRQCCLEQPGGRRGAAGRGRGRDRRETGEGQKREGRKQHTHEKKCPTARTRKSSKHSSTPVLTSPSSRVSALLSWL